MNILLIIFVFSCFCFFKELFIILTKDTAKNNFLNVVNMIREKIGDLLNKRIDISSAFVTIELNDKLK